MSYQEPQPVYQERRPIRVVSLYETPDTPTYYVDWVKEPPRHSHVYREYGLVEHLRCVHCGRVKLWKV